MTVTLFILIVIAVLPLNGSREKWPLLFSWLWLSKMLFCERNLYVDASKFDIYDPDVSIFFFWFKVTEWF
jgi:hypothetical protein